MEEHIFTYWKKVNSVWPAPQQTTRKPWSCVQRFSLTRTRKNYLWRISKQVFILLCLQAYREKDVRQQATLVHTQRTRLKSTTCMSEAEEEYWWVTTDKEEVSGEKETEREWKAYGEWLMCGGEQPHEWTNVPINNLGKLNRQEEITRDLAEQAWTGQWESLFFQCNTHWLFLFICCLLFTTMQPRFKDIICYILVSTPGFGTEYMQRGHCSWISICIAHF